MLQPRIALLSRSLLRSSPLYLRPHHPGLTLQSRQFTSAPHFRLPANVPPNPPKPTTNPPKDDAPSEKEDIFIPKPLGRPIGFPSPPKSGENIGEKKKKEYTGTTMSARNLEKRQDIVEKWSQNYFRDFKNIRKYRSGKTFLANAKVFKKEMALYFPNFHGASLALGRGANTTPVLSGRASVVRVYSSVWGEAQVDTFTSAKVNEGLHQVLATSGDVAQMVDINIEENWMKGLIIKLFQYRLRKQRKEEDWGKYFVIRRGVSDRMRETIGLLNGRVGYVYLVDKDCKIRWAGSGDAEGTEKDDLTKGLQRLVDEQRGHVVRPPMPTLKMEEGPKKALAEMPIPVPIVF
jgi:ATPase complex subunit ATP10